MASKEKRGKEKVSVDVEDISSYEEFEAQEDDDSKDYDFKEIAYVMGEEDLEEEKYEEEEEQVDQSKENNEIGNK